MDRESVTKSEDVLNEPEHKMGNVTKARGSVDPTSECPARPREEPLKVTVKRRLEREGRWAGQIELERDQMMRDAKTRFPDKADRQAWVYGELDRMYPPIPVSKPAESHFTQVALSSPRLSGLSQIPTSWPELPSNASLAAEVAWVQANRLLVVEEKDSGAVVVHLDRARTPAPSWAALGWLETSIRSYAKFIDVASKAATTSTDEAELVRRERMSIEEVRGLLAEMREAKE